MKQIIILLILIILSGCRGTITTEEADLKEPNILWITCEDITTMIGSYGDPLAHTPNIDKLASRGVLFKNAFSTAPVCAPARSCLVTGVYATSLGTQNLRSDFRIPDAIRTLPHILRENGYYCSNNYKEDYNFYDSTIWDESSHEAHWRNRAEDQPFFSVFNFETTHQSQIFGDDSTFNQKYGRLLTEEERTDPGDIILQPYYFDSPMVRKLWARYYDLVRIMDRQVGDILSQLEEDGLAENTIVFFYSDHGTGMPRAKRALYNSGVKVPLIIYLPEQYQHLMRYESGSLTDDIVSFVDFPPTVLNMLGLDIPEYMQGIPFLGDQAGERDYAYATSDRVDEAFEVSRAVKSGKYSYIRNYLPHLPLIQPNFYTDQSEIMQELLRLKKEAVMTPAQQSMWLEKRLPEELYDLENDPFETNNLAQEPAYHDVLVLMRNKLIAWQKKTHDTGLLPEGYLLEHTNGSTAYQLAQSSQFYPIDKVLETTSIQLDPGFEAERLSERLNDEEMLVRYWAAVSLQYAIDPTEEVLQALSEALNDKSEYVRLAAAESSCALGNCTSYAQEVILEGLRSDEKIIALMAARIFELNRDRALEIIPEVKAMHEKLCNSSHGKWQGYDLYACWALNEAFK